MAVTRDSHIPALRRLRNGVHLCAVCDLNSGLARRVASSRGVPGAYGSLSELLSREEPDVVFVCTPPQSHELLAVEALEKGCHVLVEKPMATSVAGCDRMIEAAKRSGVKLSVVHMKRFQPPFVKAREMLEGGLIGSLTGLRFLSIYALWHGGIFAESGHWVHSLSGGVFSETGAHPVYMSLVLAGKVKRVHVVARSITPFPWVVHSEYRIEFEGERANSSVCISFGNGYTTDECEVLGTDCHLNVDLQTMLLTRYERRTYRRTDLVMSSVSRVGQILRGTVSNTLQVALGRSFRFRGHDILIERFVESILEDAPPPVLPEEGRETVRVMEMVTEQLPKPARDYEKRQS